MKSEFKSPRDPKRQTKRLSGIRVARGLKAPDFGRTTERLLIRPFIDSDYVKWKEAHLRAGAGKNEWESDYAKRAKEITRAKFCRDLKEARKKRVAGTFFRFGVFLRKSDELVGSVSLMDISRGVYQNGILGYGILNPYWGNGYAVEACEAALDIAFRDLRLHRVEAGVEPGNKQSHRVAKKLGMRDEGTSPRKLFLRGKWRDMVNYALTCEERGIRWKTVLKDG